MDCAELVELPGGLFTNTVIDFFDKLCYRSNKLNKIGERFFETRNPAGTVVSMDTVFAVCDILEIPSDLFNYFDSYSSINSIFRENLNLKAIPGVLFDNIKRLDECKEMFYKCYAVTGKIPEVWNMFTFSSTSKHSSAFAGLQKADNYSEIPYYWK